MADDRINGADGSCVTVDTVFIKGLKAASVIGCYDWERDIRQTLVIDLELKADFSRAAETDAGGGRSLPGAGTPPVRSHDGRR